MIWKTVTDLEESAGPERSCPRAGKRVTFKIKERSAMTSQKDVTQLLLQWREGDEAALAGTWTTWPSSAAIPPAPSISAPPL
ncbi:hypothetical protein L0222_29980, partial [bacterium]|nr:hypothetical protein [bacterium]